MRRSKGWLVADVEGLAKLVEHRPRAFLVYELLSNALDETTQRIDITLEKLPGRPFARLVVADDNPTGFQDLTHAYTLFAESRKKVNPEQRGRFNMGEKVVLSLCREARIISTTGVVEFAEDGTRIEHSRERTASGSRFEALVRMNQEEYDRCLAEIQWVLLPEGVEVFLNQERLEPRTPVVEFKGTLPTVLADAEGALRPTRRITTLQVFEPRSGEEAMIYEMGIPVVATGDRFHVNVLQKVPLNLDRDNVTPAFLQAVRTLVVNHTHHLLAEGDVTKPWVDQAMRDPKISEDATKALLTARFGEKAVIADPSDPEATHRAMAEGYTVIPGRSLDAAQWANVRKAQAVQPAGRVFPTAKPYSNDPRAEPVRVIPPEEWTDGIRAVVALTRRLARALMGIEIDVRVVHTTNGFSACYGSRTLDFNLLRLGHGFFDHWQENLARVLDLLLDEFGHEYESNHLSESYYRALRKLGAKMTVLALEQPELFRPQVGEVVSANA